MALVPSPRVLDAAENKLERLPLASLQPTLQRLVLSCNRISGLEGLEVLRNLKVRPGAAPCPGLLGPRALRWLELSPAGRAGPWVECRRGALARAAFLPACLPARADRCTRPELLPALPAPHQVLALDGNRISQLPASIGQLSRLESLALSDNLLTELPPALGRLARLRQLLVSQNRLARLPHELGDCGQLEELDVHHNALTVGAGPGTGGRGATKRPTVWVEAAGCRAGAG